MWTLTTRIAVAASIIGVALTGCAETVHNPISPQQARAQVLNAARDIVTTLHSQVTEATFSYESCNDQGEPPFRGVAKVAFWLPGIPHNEPADAQTVIKGLVADGWSTDSDFKSHSPTLRKDNVNIILTVSPRPPAGVELNSHARVDVNGECRDTTDHRTDGSIVPADISKEIQQP
ncbi:putative lipoprotein LppJ [Mycobacterium montefiorense]|nr:hypothetical protein [Mycobacterium montefiorense]GLE50542.1 putative lipoprotein LppJ [Mycobacterium montefiorense]